LATSHVYAEIPRVDPALLARLKDISVADLHDALDVDWRLRTLMAPQMRALVPGVHFVGQAVTAFCPAGDNLMMHAGLFLARPGDVLVVSNGGIPLGALWGDNAGLQARNKGIAAVVVDGPIRDTDALRRMQFPVWSTHVSVSTPSKDKLGSVNVPIQCGGVLVNPGDIVVGDGDGVLVLPPAIIPVIAKRAGERAAKDAKLRAAIEAGGTLFETLAFDKSLEALGGTIQQRSWNS
jgi:4-hydroxy-4-methyl-2-oxoglutarate aldolase